MCVLVKGEVTVKGTSWMMFFMDRMVMSDECGVCGYLQTVE